MLAVSGYGMGLAGAGVAMVGGVGLRSYGVGLDVDVVVGWEWGILLLSMPVLLMFARCYC